MPIVKKLQKRPLKEIFAVVYLDTIYFHVRCGGRIHQIRNTTRFLSYKNIKALIANLKRVYIAASEDIALIELDTFAEIVKISIQLFQSHGEKIGYI